MQHKQFQLIETKADTDHGTFEATVAVFGNVDKAGDRIVPGAFTKTLERWRGSGDPVPVILSHDWTNPFSHIGVADPHEMQQTGQGLRIKARLDVQDNDVARQVHRLMQRRSLKEFSFGYRVPSGGQRRGKDGANELYEIDLVELGPCLKGVNSQTELHAVKAALVERDEYPQGAEQSLLKVTHEEMAGVQDGRLKAVWTTAYVNSLPDSAFLYIEPGGDKDSEGKTTPRSLRHFPYKDDSGAVDLPHLRNALARIPQSSLPQDVKDRVTRRAQAILDNQKAGQDHLQKAVWTASYINDLPDSSFLYVESGGSKDNEGKTTPRSLRHFPVKDAGGSVDMPHLRNALSRIPQSNLPQSVKDECTARAQRMLNANKADMVDQPHRRPADPLRALADAVELEFASGGESQRKSRTPKPPERPRPQLSLRELRQKAHDEMLIALSGIEDI